MHRSYSDFFFFSSNQANQLMPIIYCLALLPGIDCINRFLETEALPYIKKIDIGLTEILGSLK